MFVQGNSTFWGWSWKSRRVWWIWKWFTFSQSFSFSDLLWKQFLFRKSPTRLSHQATYQWSSYEYEKVICLKFGFYDQYFSKTKGFSDTCFEGQEGWHSTIRYNYWIVSEQKTSTSKVNFYQENIKIRIRLFSILTICKGGLKKKDCWYLNFSRPNFLDFMSFPISYLLKLFKKVI